MKRLTATLCIALLGLVHALAAQAQQVPDRDADVTVNAPAFEAGTGPVVAIDGAHWNFHTLENRFAPFAALLRRDGFRVTALDTTFSAESLRGFDVLVIANALNEANHERWTVPVPSAFTADEVEALTNWVAHGGSLLLIADHFPFAGAAADLAAAFGFEFVNGFALTAPADGADIFNLQSGTLRDHAITRGRNEQEKIAELATFTGSAFRAPEKARPLIVLPETFVLLLPTVAWQFDESTPWLRSTGHLQGAAMRHGAGRLAVFGEAGMFTAQRNERDAEARVGFNAEHATQNRQFILNTLRWLAGVISD